MMIIAIIIWGAQTEQVSLQAGLYNFILDVPVSYLSQDTLSLLRYSWFSSVPPGKCQDSTWIRQRPLLLKSFFQSS
jgi:hypothetical protein